MRILYVINGFDPGGAEHGLNTLLRAGFFDDHELKILAFCRGHGGLAGEISVKAGDDGLILASPDEQLSARACVRGFTMMLRLFRQWRPDMVVLSLKQANLVGRLAALFAPRIRCVSFEHTMRYRARRAGGFYGPALKALSWRVNEVWADCETTLVETQDYFLPRRRRHQVVPLFAADAAVGGKQDYALHASLRLAAAGRLIDLKNFDLAIEAVRLLTDRGVAATLDCYGDGPERCRLLDKAEELGLRDRVRLHGYVPRWFEKAIDSDIFLNLSDTEGFCIVVAEAMLAGLPVIATFAGGIREYGADDVNLLRLAEPSAELVATQVERLANDEPLRQRLGTEARATMLREYSPEALRNRAATVLEEGGGCWVSRKEDFKSRVKKL